MKRFLFKSLYLVAFATLLLYTQSCSSDELVDTEGADQETEDNNMLSALSGENLTDMKAFLADQEIIIENEGDEDQSKFLAQLFVQAYKVTCKTPHPANNGTQVNMSGVLLMPKYRNKNTKYNFIVANPYTYTSKDEAPSEMFGRSLSILQFNNDKPNINLYAFLSSYASTRSIVLIPDYLGFGDSYGQCATPYVDSKPMVRSIIDLIKESKNVVASKKLKLSDKINIMGYSQGGFISAALARELETNPAHGINVKLLVTGGTPINFRNIIETIVKKETLSTSFVGPYALWGLSQNSYRDIDPADCLNQPYASNLSSVFNGTNSDVLASFPANTKELYTSEFLNIATSNSPNMVRMKEVLDEISVKPWANKCSFVMSHAINDDVIYYDNITDFVSEQKRIGSVQLRVDENMKTDHGRGIIHYLVILNKQLPLYIND